MRISHFVAALLAAASFHAGAERTPPRPMSVSESADEARVIVRFKGDASVLRAHALSAGAPPQSHAQTLDARALALGARHGMALRSGAAVGEGVQVMHGPAGMSSQALADQLLRDTDVAWAEPDRRVRRALVPNDPLFATGGTQGPAAGQWYLRAPAGEIVSSINAVTAWDTTTGSASVIVAVLDTGVRADHPDLAGKLIGGYDFVSDVKISNDRDGRDADPSDPGDWVSQADKTADPATFDGTCGVSPSSWHGTQVSGIVGAATFNGTGMAGAGYNVRVMPVRVLGKCFGFTSDIQAAMRWAAGLAVDGVRTNPNPAQVINLSLGGSAGSCSPEWSRAVADVNARGVVVVAAAGNGAGRAASSPANCPGVIGVAGVRHVGTKVGFSDIGPEVSIAAPGGNCVNIGEGEPCLYPILSTADSGQTAPQGASYTGSGADAAVGTSFSSPLVAATAALMLSVQPTMTPAALKSAMQTSARPFPASGLPDDPSTGPIPTCRAPGNFDQVQCYCTKATCGAGMLDASAAVAAALGAAPNPNPTPTPTPTPAPTGDGGGGGGGSMSLVWLLALSAAVGLLLRRPRRGVISAAVVAVIAAAVVPSSWAAPPATHVNGLIVQLRDAPTHAELMRERAQAATQAVAPREQGRWRELVAAMPSMRVAERRAVGASAQLLRFERPMTTQQARAFAEQLAQRPDVAWTALNTRERRLQATPPANAPPSDPRYSGQWWLQLPGVGSNGAPNYLTAWTSVTTGDPNSLVAVLDNGIVAHPDLAGKVINGYDMVSDTAFSNDPDGRDPNPADPGDWVDAADLQLQDYKDFNCQAEPSSWHGTVIAGLLAATVNNEGVASMNWPGRVLVVRVAAKCGADVVDIVDGIRWVAGLAVCLRSDASGACLELSSELPAPRARVINISFGGDGECGREYQPAIDAARARGVAIVAAAGNEHAATPTRPAKCPGVIGVAALNRDGFKSTYSNFGSAIKVATVGGDDTDGAWGSRVADGGLVSVGNFGETVPGASIYLPHVGTSFSTPIVAGAVSLMLAVNPALTVDQIEQGLRVSARPHVTSALPGVAACSNANPGRCLCTTTTCGAGILDVPQALAYADALRLGNPYTPPTWPVVSIDSAQLREAAAGGPDRPANPTAPPTGGGDGGGDGGSGGGGGSMSGLWLLLLGTAVLALRRRSAAQR